MGRYQSQLIRTGSLMKARASAQPRLLASANDRQPVESQSQKPLKRPARKVVFNACENCRVRKTKWYGALHILHGEPDRLHLHRSSARTDKAREYRLETRSGGSPARPS